MYIKITSVLILIFVLLAIIRRYFPDIDFIVPLSVVIGLVPILYMIVSLVKRAK